MTNSSPSDVYDFLFKIIIIGDSGTGKTSILNRYTRNEFTVESKSTIGVELASSMVNLEGKQIKLSIWDTAGQDRFRAATNLYYRNTLGAFIVFDLTNHYSFQNVPKWLQELKEHVDKNVFITLIGNKSDLRHLRAVSKDDAAFYADKHDMTYIETSALDAANIEKAFRDITTEIYQKIYEINEEITVNTSNETKANVVNLTISPDSDKSTCCKLN